MSDTFSFITNEKCSVHESRAFLNLSLRVKGRPVGAADWVYNIWPIKIRLKYSSFRWVTLDFIGPLWRQFVSVVMWCELAWPAAAAVDKGSQDADKCSIAADNNIASRPPFENNLLTRFSGAAKQLRSIRAFHYESHPFRHHRLPRLSHKLSHTFCSISRQTGFRIGWRRRRNKLIAGSPQMRARLEWLESEMWVCRGWGVDCGMIPVLRPVATTKCEFHFFFSPLLLREIHWPLP